MCDNQGVFKNMSLHQYNLVKKYVAVNYHAVRKAYASGIVLLGT